MSCFILHSLKSVHSVCKTNLNTYIPYKKYVYSTYHFRKLSLASHQVQYIFICDCTFGYILVSFRVLILESVGGEYTTIVYQQLIRLTWFMTCDICWRFWLACIDLVVSQSPGAAMRTVCLPSPSAPLDAGERCGRQAAHQRHAPSAVCVTSSL